MRLTIIMSVASSSKAREVEVHQHDERNELLDHPRDVGEQAGSPALQSSQDTNVCDDSHQQAPRDASTRNLARLEQSAEAQDTAREQHEDGSSESAVVVFTGSDAERDVDQGVDGAHAVKVGAEDGSSVAETAAKSTADDKTAVDVGEVPRPDGAGSQRVALRHALETCAVI